MNKKEFERRQQQEKTLMVLGFTAAEAEQLRRISMTLQRWHELECGTENGCVERDDNGDGPPYMVRHVSGRGRFPDRVLRYPIPDRETGARKRLAAIIERRNSYGDIIEHASGGCTIQKRAPLTAYIQTDPRGAALYILRPGDVPEGENAGAYYSRGVCVY